MVKHIIYFNKNLHIYKLINISTSKLFIKFLTPFIALIFKLINEELI